MTDIVGLNHAAVLTPSLDRFIDFYRRMFAVEVVFTERSAALSHAILRLGKDSWLHPVEMIGNPHARAVPAMFQRGHIDHVSLTAACAESFARIRDRLIGARASDGRVETCGPFNTLWFVDPDGMRGEVTLIVDATLSGIHEPTPLQVA